MPHIHEAFQFGCECAVAAIVKSTSYAQNTGVKKPMRLAAHRLGADIA
jgi:hypothetical protein